MIGLTFARVLAELTPEELAVRIGVTRPLISSWENGKIIPDKRKEQLGKTLSVDSRYLDMELTAKDKLEVMIQHMGQYEAKNRIDSEMQALMRNLSDMDNHDLSENQMRLLKIEILKMLLEISENIIVASDCNNQETRKKIWNFLNNINFIVKEGVEKNIRIITDATKQMEQMKKGMISSYLTTK